jgi:molybdenum ABC transporter molybdate-binding protein
MRTRLACGARIAAFFGAALSLVSCGGRDGPDGGTKPLLVFCAAGLKAPVEDLAQAFRKEHGVEVQIQYGGSGTLLASLKVSRSGDLYLPADASYLDDTQGGPLVDEILPLAHQTPVLAVRPGNPLKIAGVADLARPDVRVSLANPEAAAIGRVVREALRAAGAWDAVEENIRAHGVFKPTVNESLNDLKLGAVDAAVVWDSLARQHPEIEALPAPEFAHGRAEVSAAVLKSSAQPTLALRFARYLNSRVGNASFKRNGFEPVEGDAWAWEPEITFFCGAVNRRAVDEIINAFAAREGVRINTVYNGCGILTGQMKAIREGPSGGQGFPDIYLACDRYYLDNVKDWFQDGVDVSRAAIVIAVQKGNPSGIRSLRDLARPGLRVAVGQPEQCTIGALTRTMLEKEGLYDAIMSNVVMQAASSAMIVPTVTTRSVDAAIAYITDTLASTQSVEVVTIESPFAVAVQPFAVARSSDHKYLGQRLFRAIAAGRSSFEKAGFTFTAGAGGGPGGTPAP